MLYIGLFLLAFETVFIPQAKFSKISLAKIPSAKITANAVVEVNPAGNHHTIKTIRT